MEVPYQSISEILNQICPSGYSKAWVEAEVKEDWNKQRLWYEKDGQNKQPDIDALKQYKLGEYLTEIQTQMTIPGQKPWSKCTFTLYPDGKFKFDVDYDD
jgi:hypothetical protein